MKYITKEVRIGIAGIVALCVLIYGINWLKGIHMFQPSSYFYAKFETFPIWNLPLKHPVNLAYEAATADRKSTRLNSSHRL